MLKTMNLSKGGKGMKYFVYVAALTLATAGTCLATGRLVSVPVFTPWGTLITAAALGASGLYTFFRKRK
jgi:predicted metal-binding membrane protein